MSNCLENVRDRQNIGFFFRFCRHSVRCKPAHEVPPADVSLCARTSTQPVNKMAISARAETDVRIVNPLRCWTPSPLSVLRFPNVKCALAFVRCALYLFRWRNYPIASSQSSLMKLHIWSSKQVQRTAPQPRTFDIWGNEGMRGLSPHSSFIPVPLNSIHPASWEPRLSRWVQCTVPPFSVHSY